MIPARLQRYLKLQRIAGALAGFAFGIVVSVFASWVYEHFLILLPWLIAIAIVFFLVAGVLALRKPAGIDVTIRAPLTIRSPEEAQRYARRGFAGFVPLYTPKPGTVAGKLSLEERAKAVAKLDFERLQVEESNLQPTIRAIMSHASRIEHCWLLATCGEQAAGSLPYARLLAEYLRQCKGLRCQFHYGEEYSVSLDDDALVLNKTYLQVRKVLREAAQLKIGMRDLVADITTGVRSMTLAMILASLDRDQDVEFVGTHYNADGQPIGPLFPIIFSFEPVIE